VITKIRKERTSAPPPARGNPANQIPTYRVGDIVAWKRTDQDWIFC